MAFMQCAPIKFSSVKCAWTGCGRQWHPYPGTDLKQGVESSRPRVDDHCSVDAFCAKEARGDSRSDGTVGR